MVGLFLTAIMLAMAGFCYASFTVANDADVRAREAWERMRVEQIREQGQCDYRCKGCPVELLCLTKLEKGRTTQDCVEQWLRDRGYLEEPRREAISCDA